MTLESLFGIPSKQPANTQVSGPQEGRITRHAPDGGVYFRLPNYSPTLEFGPAKWVRHLVQETDHAHDPQLPPVGAVCLVVFVGPGIQRPWVLGWW